MLKICLILQNFLINYPFKGVTWGAFQELEAREKFTITKGSVGPYGYNGEISEFQMTSSTERLNLFKDLWFLKKNATVDISNQQTNV